MFHCPKVLPYLAEAAVASSNEGNGEHVTAVLLAEYSAACQVLEELAKELPLHARLGFFKRPPRSNRYAVMKSIAQHCMPQMPSEMQLEVTNLSYDYDEGAMPPQLCITELADTMRLIEGALASLEETLLGRK